MNQKNGKQREVTVFDRRCLIGGVRASKEEARRWLKRFPVCQALGQHHILHLGVARTSAPLGFTLAEQNSACFVASFGGEGRIQVDGRWHRCRAGTGCLLPLRTTDVLPDGDGAPWEFCWACFEQPPGQRPAPGAAAPIMARFDPVPLRCAIEGLTYECRRRGTPSVIDHWVNLIRTYVTEFIHPDDEDGRLGQLWQRVSAHLDAGWNLARLAHEFGYSYGHLRRLCWRQLGRSPMHHITYLRMRRAAELLATTNYKIEALAQAVGYTNPFVFSNAFTRWVGWRPSDYRRRHLESWTPGS